MNDTILSLSHTLFQEKKDGTDSITEVLETVVIVVVITASNVGVYSGAGVMVVMMRTASLRARRFRSAAADVVDVVEEGGEISATPSPR